MKAGLKWTGEKRLGVAATLGKEPRMSVNEAKE